MRRHRTSGRVFSRPRYRGKMILVGVHKRKRDARRKIEDRRYRINNSRIVKHKGRYEAFVHYK